MEEYSRNLISLLIAPHFQIGCRHWKTDEAFPILVHLCISIFGHMTFEILEFVHILYVLVSEAMLRVTSILTGLASLFKTWLPVSAGRLIIIQDMAG